MSTNNVAYSVVIPLLNEEDSIPELYARLKNELERLTQGNREQFEIILVDDGSTDHSFALLSEIAAIDSRVSVIQFRKSYGKTAALVAGFERARGRITLTMDGDLQHHPEDIPRFIEKIYEGYDIVCGWREKRVDNLWFRRIPSKIANYFMRKLSDVDISDFGGGFKAYRTSLLKAVPLYGGMQRFIPALASIQGARICQLAIENTPRRFGKSRYGISRVIPVFFDLLRIHFLLHYLQQPLRFFGSIGMFFFGAGTLTGFGLFLTWLFGSRTIIHDHGPLALTASICVIGGIQFLMLGLIGEMLLWFNNNRNKNQYTVASVVEEGRLEHF
ncbi:MAG: glycosyltransferase family 2 protein [Acidobacteriaceae bacterium]|nr:glycosyltransferase family 2 protein [Acidobacteriaceae bacterium]